MHRTLSSGFYLYLVLIIAVVGANIILKYLFDFGYIRYFLKPIVPILILHHYIKNVKNYKKEKSVLVASSIILFFIGDMFFLGRYSSFNFNVALVLLVVARICFIGRFLNHEDFKFQRIIPFLIFCSLYMLFILTAIINNLKDVYFIQVLVYLFVTLLFGLFTYLRYKAVNRTSFNLVLIGFLLMLVMDGLTALNMFSSGFQYNMVSSAVIALAFNLSQFFIVEGLIKEGQNIKKVH